MNPKCLLRIAAVALLAGTILACAVELGRPGRGSETLGSSINDNNDPLAAEFGRCKALGVEVVHDAACKAAWRKYRERFLAPRNSPAIDRSPEASDDRKPLPDTDADRTPLAPPPNFGRVPGTNSDGR
jgi:conjugative transfer region protein TrbK